MRSIADLKERMERVNDYWIAQNPEPGNCAWERAAYFLGNMAAIEVLKKPRYLEYAVEWAQANHWNFYDNAAHCTVNADNVSCGETYLDLMENYGILGKMEHIRATMEWTASDPHNDYWWWVDTMYMALHFYNRMGLLLEDDRLIDKAYRLYLNAKEERHLYDREEKLWFRDENFLPEIARTAGGRKVFWARGNGWVFAGLARTLRTLPPEQKYYREYREVFTGMAQALEKCQCGDGFWRTSLLEPEEYPMPETSGTVLTVLGMVIGVRLGILPERYMECALRGFDALNREAVGASGRIGWVQVVALKPGPVKKEDSNDYAVGTYLLVCRELIAYFSR
nr:glycoside hydrolase family 88 protein [uncultured Acetatifactor sp.]